MKLFQRISYNYKEHTDMYTGAHTRRQIESSLDEEGVESNGIYVIKKEFWSHPPTPGNALYPRHGILHIFCAFINTKAL